jgi:lipoprotein-releasing system permease protein
MLFLALRQLLNRKRQTFLTFIAIILGASGYVIFSGLQLGQSDFMVDQLISAEGHITIMPRDEYITVQSLKGIFFAGKNIRWKNTPSGRRENTSISSSLIWYNKLDADKRVNTYTPLLIKAALVKNGGFEQNITIVGIDTKRHTQTTNLDDYITEGTIENLSKSTSLVITGEELLKYLGAGIGDSITVTFPGGNSYPLKISGSFNTGDRRADESTIYTSLSTLQQISDSRGEVSKIIIKLHDINQSADIATEYNQTSQDKVESWDQIHASHLSILDSQSIVVNITLFAFILVIAFGIYNILNMAVMNKKRDIAIIRAMGYNQSDVIQLYLVQGAIIALSGAILGIAFGYVMCKYIETIPVPIGKGHMIISWDVYIYVRAFVLVVSSAIIASFFPARQAGMMTPISIIRESV